MKSARKATVITRYSKGRGALKTKKKKKEITNQNKATNLRSSLLAHDY